VAVAASLRTGRRLSSWADAPLDFRPLGYAPVILFSRQGDIILNELTAVNLRIELHHFDPNQSCRRQWRPISIRQTLLATVHRSQAGEPSI